MRNYQKFISSNRRSNLSLLVQLSLFALVTTSSLFLWQTSAQMQSNTGSPSSPQADGDYDATFNTRLDNGVIFNIEAQPDGKVLIAGNFNSIEGLTRTHVARLNNNGSLDQSFNAGSGGNNTATGVSLIAVQPDGKIIVGGTFTTFNGFATDKYARLNADGSVDTSFRSTLGSLSLGTGASALTVLANGQYLVDGLFGSGERGILRLNSDGSRDASFVGAPPVGIVRSAFSIIQQPDGKILAAVVNFYNDGNRNCIARFNASGTLDTAFNPVCTPNSAATGATSLALQPDGKIIAVGTFTGINGTSANRIARLNADGSTDTSFNAGGAGANNTPNIIKRQADGKLLIAGDFTVYNGVARNRIARLNADGTLDTSFNPGTGADNSIRNLILQTDGKILINGSFVFYNGIPTQGIARILNTVGAAPPTTRRTVFDFDGDGKADVSVFRPSNGVWYLLQSTNGFTGIQFGASGDVLVPADYDGDGKTDEAVFRSGTWYLNRSQTGFTGIAFGASDDIPVPADYDGDGKADVAVFRPSNGTWYLLRSAAGFTGVQFGATGDKPVAADYDGDGKTDIAVNRAGTWYLMRSTLGFTGVQFGDSNDKLVPADYDGDGKADIAVFRPSNGVWYLLQSTAGFTGVQFGLGTDLLTPADYDGDGKADVAVFRSGTWFLNRSTQGFTGIAFGAASDKPVPNAYIP